jgi:hypothetical protein
LQVYCCIEKGGCQPELISWIFRKGAHFMDRWGIDYFLFSPQLFFYNFMVEIVGIYPFTAWIEAGTNHAGLLLQRQSGMPIRAYFHV